jgi:hypothetical protein
MFDTEQTRDNIPSNFTIRTIEGGMFAFDSGENGSTDKEPFRLFDYTSIEEGDVHVIQKTKDILD